MLGTRTAGELAGGSLILELAGELARGATLRAGREAAGTGLRAAIEDRLAALNSGATGVCAWRRSDRNGWGRRSFVDRTRAGLGHDDAAHLGRRHNRGNGFNRGNGNT
jgi:hypothetical protein